MNENNRIAAESKGAPSVSKSLLPFYGYETDGTPLDDSPEGGQEQSMTELWNRLHKDRPIMGGEYKDVHCT